MKVEVKPELVETFVGFYDNKRRRPGDVFELKDAVTKVKGKEVTIPAKDFFSDKWMNEVDSPKPTKKKATSENLTL